MIVQSMVVYPFFRSIGIIYEKGTLQFIATRRVLLGISLYFFGPRGLNLRKSPFWSLLSHLRLSKHETTNEFAFIGLIKSNNEGPFPRMKPSFLRFIKCMRTDSSLDELQRVFVTLFELVKMKRGTNPLRWRN